MGDGGYCIVKGVTHVCWSGSNVFCVQIIITSGEVWVDLGC